mgnify:FL=1|jgi:hypothetical protein
MGNFGWAYINCSDTGSATGNANGPSGSVQYMTGAGDTFSSGSANFTYQSAHNLLQLTGTLSVTGTISASHMHIEDVTVIDATGSTKFGNSNDDTHIRTGSLSVWKADGAGYVLSASVAETRVYITGSGGLTVSGAFQGNYRNVLVDKVTASAGDYIVGINVGDLRTDFRLPSAATVGRGGIVIVKDEYPGSRSTGSAIHISGSGADTIDNATYYLLTGSMPAIHLYSNGATEWYVF